MYAPVEPQVLHDWTFFHVHPFEDPRETFMPLVFIVSRLCEEKRRDIVFGFPSFRPPVGVCILCAQILLQFYSDSFKTLPMS